VKGFKLPKDSGGHLAYLLEPSRKDGKDEPAEANKEKEEEKAEGKKPDEKKKKEPGTDLVVRELATGTELTIREVSDYVWSTNGEWLAYSVSSKVGANDGAYLRATNDGRTHQLLTGAGEYKQLALDEKCSQVAFVSNRDSFSRDTPTFKLYHSSTSRIAVRELLSSTTSGLEPDMAVSEHGQVEFSKDGRRVFFGVSPTTKPRPPDAPEAIRVDIWHWKDPELQPMQKARAEEERKRSFRALFDLVDKRFVQLASPEIPTISLGDNGTLAIATSNIPYRQLLSWDTRYDDVYAVDLRDGSRRKIVEKTPFEATLSPGGRYILYFSPLEAQWYAHNLATGRAVNLTGKLGVKFDQEVWDTPGVPRPYGVAGWTDHDRTVLVYDRYDIWEIKPDGSLARPLTRGLGRRERIVFRYQDLDQETKTIADPVFLRAVSEITKASGVYRGTLTGTGEPEKLFMIDKAMNIVTKAKEADRFVFTLSTFEQFPDLWVSSGTFTNPSRITDANPQQSKYVWGRSELISFRNADGVPLEAILTKPENFDPTKKYPLMVYIYERLVQGL
ncbi:MAG: prolyl oligopeptidase family serine peptidase, partial [Acidimicrobiia bacterium]